MTISRVFKQPHVDLPHLHPVEAQHKQGFAWCSCTCQQARSVLIIKPVYVTILLKEAMAGSQLLLAPCLCLCLCNCLGPNSVLVITLAIIAFIIYSMLPALVVCLTDPCSC